MQTPHTEDATREKTSDPGLEPDVQTVVLGWSLTELVEQTQLLEAQGLIEQACVAYQIWLHASRQPHLAHVALFNLGALQQARGDTEAALGSYLQCIDQAPAFGQAYINLGLLQERLGRIDDALQTWGRYLGQRLLKTQADTDLQCTALNHIGRVQEGRKRYELAEKALEDSLRLNPDQPGVIQHWVHIRQKACCWPVYTDLPDLPGLPLGKRVHSTSPLAMLALTDDPQLQLLTAQNFVRRTYASEESRLHDPTRRPGPRWRVGLVSADFREHAVGFLLPAFLRGTDRSAYALYAYDYPREENSALRRDLLSQFDEVRQIAALNDRQAAELIAADQIDILIDLHGLSAGARPGIFAMHPAPRQVTYLGYIGSTGMPWFQHVLVDPWAMPADLVPHFTEQPLYLNRSFIPLTHEAPAPATVTRAMARLPERAFVMAAFGNVYKITPDMFSSWLRLLQRIPDAVLWLLDDNPVTTRALRAHAQAQGADLDRIVFAPRCEPGQFRAQLRLADVYLDTYPYNCGSTSNDVVNAGVPLVSRYGRTLVSRMGLSILSDLGRPDLAVESQQAYEDKVLEVALRTREGYRYHYEHRPTVGLLQQALDTLRYGRRQALARSEPASDHRRLRLVQLAPSAVRPSKDQHDLVTWTLAQWAGFESLREHLMQHTLDPQALHWLDARCAPDAAGERELQKALAQSDVPCDALIASPGWDVHSLQANPLEVWGSRLPEWMDWACRFLADHGWPDPANWVLPLERSVSGLALACTPAIWFDWLDLALHVRAEHQKTLSSAQGLWQMGDHTLSSAQLLYPWLMNLVLQRRNSQVHALNPFSRHTLQSHARSLLPLAVQAAALKSAYHLTGQRHYLQAFEQLCQHQGLQGEGRRVSKLAQAVAPETSA